MRSEIIHFVSCDNYDSFQHLNFLFFKKNRFTILKIN
jgi:hypothetical protein